MPLRRLLALALAACTFTAVGYAQAAPAAAPKVDPACPASRCVDIRVPAPAGVQVAADKARVLLPVGYAKTSRRYPVVYVLNGALGDYTQWTRQTDIVDYTAQFPAIFVFPDGGGRGQAGWYSDWLDGSYQWETWHIGSVLPYVDRRFRTDPDARAVAGASMGANGALTYAARHPELFRTAVAFSGWNDTQLGTPVTAEVAKSDVTAPQDMTRVWGDQLLDADVWAQHNPTALAKGLKDVVVFSSQGTGSYAGDAGAHGGQREANLFLCAPSYLSALNAAGVAHHDLIYSGGEHSWPTFTRTLRWAFPLMMDVLEGRPVVDRDPSPAGFARLPLGNWRT
jgi:S-formylglutathione hydrolase FrmB